jgi:hypothetical protein
LISSYLFVFLLFLLPVLLLWLGIPRQFRNGESRNPCLASEFRGNGFSFFPLRMMLAIGLSYIASIMLKYIHSISSFIRAFIMKWC